LRSTDLERTVTVARLVNKRVGAVIAADCFVDLTPPPPQKEEIPATVLRDRGAGRPTKRERRDLERLRGRTGEQ
jgi:ribosome-associated heat shock protein Hsp15